MKKTIYLLLFVVITSLSLASCGEKCKKCQAEAMGVKVGPEKELCGDELKRAEASGVMNCK